VVRFLERVVADPVALGEEPARDYRPALAGHLAEPRAIGRGLVRDGRTVSAALLPWAADPDDWRTHLLVRSVFERQLPSLVR
jgi:hypothetical protein